MKKESQKKGIKLEDLGTAVITVRLSERTHAALKEEARLRGMTLNRLCFCQLLTLLRDPKSPNQYAAGAVQELVSANYDPGEVRDYMAPRDRSAS